MSDMADPKTLKTLIEAGSVRDALAVADGRKWRAEINVGMSRRAISTKRGELRMWSSLDSLARYLKEVGIVKWSVDATYLSSQDQMI